MAAKLTRKIRLTMSISEWFLAVPSSRIHWSISFCCQTISEIQKRWQDNRPVCPTSHRQVPSYLPSFQ